LVNDEEKKSALSAKQNEALRSYLHNLFSAYTVLLRQNKIEEPDIILFAVENWKDVTLRIINIVLEIEGQKVRLSSYRPGDIVHHAVFSSPQHWKWEILQEIRVKSDYIIQAAYLSYAEQVKTGKLRFPWSSDLIKLNIDYHGLHHVMNNKYFSNISPELFEDYIMSANFSRLEESILGTPRDGYRGVLHFLVKQIGLHNDQWFSTAIKTLRTVDGKQYSNRREFLNSIQESKQNIKDFKTALNNMHIQLPPPPVL